MSDSVAGLGNSKYRRRHILLLTGIEADLLSENPVLLRGEAILVWDVKRVKIGDGITDFVNLPYIDQYDEVLEVLNNVNAMVYDSEVAINSAKMTLDQQQSRIQSLANQLSAVQASLVDFQSIMTNKYNNLDSRLTVIQSTYPDRIDTLTGEVESAEMAIASLDQAVVDAYQTRDATIQSLNQTTVILDNRISQMDVTIVQLNNDMNNIQSMLSSEIQSLLNRMDLLQTEIDIDPEIFDTISNIQTIIDDKLSEIDSLNYDVNQYFDQKIIELGELENRIENIETSLQSLEDAVLNIETSIESGVIHQRLSALELASNTLSDTAGSIQDSIHLIENDVLQLQDDVNSTKAVVNSVEANFSESLFRGFIRVDAGESLSDINPAEQPVGAFVLTLDRQTGSVKLFVVNDDLEWEEHEGVVTALHTSGQTAYDLDALEIILSD